MMRPDKGDNIKYAANHEERGTIPKSIALSARGREVLTNQVSQRAEHCPAYARACGIGGHAARQGGQYSVARGRNTLKLKRAKRA